MRKKRELILLFCFVICFNIHSQNNIKIPFREIIINKEVVYNDSTKMAKPIVEFFYCDSSGNVMDTCQGYYLIVYNKFKIIFEYYNADSRKSLADCYTKLEIDKLDLFKWSGKIRKKRKKRLFAYYSSCTNAWITKSILKDEVATLLLP